MPPNLKNCIQKQFDTLNINVHKFNYANIALIIIASIISSIALLTDNYQTVIASKIIGLAIIPFISLCIMLIAGSRAEILKSVGSCGLFIGLCLVVSGIIGFVNKLTQWKEEPTNEMLTRAHFKYESIWIELGMSAVAGIGIYYAIMKTSVIALVGLILAISIIPPLCNAGLFWGMHIYNILEHSRNNCENANAIGYENEKENYLEYGTHSFVIFASNITGMFFGFMLAFVASCVF
jgi:uncharacterized membrane protein